MTSVSKSAVPAEFGAYLMSLELFKDFDARSLHDVAAEMRHVRIAEGETLIRQGDAGDSMYVLVHGRLRVTIQHADNTEQVIDELSPGVTVGELALLTGQPRVASVSAAEASELIHLSKAAFDRLATKNPAAMMRFAEAMTRRMKRKALAGTLKRLFGDLGPQSIEALESRLEWRHLRSGEWLVHEGDFDDALFVVVSGRLRAVTAGPDGVEHVVSEIGRDETVGEWAFVTGERQPVSVYAIRDTDVVRFARPVFEHVIEQNPQMMMQVMRLMVKRVHRPDSSSWSGNAKGATVAVLPARGDVPMKDFAARLATALAALGPTLYLSSDRLDSMLNKQGVAQTDEDHPTHPALASWLNDQETRYRYVVYEADTWWSAWSARCIRHADRTLIVGVSSGRPEPSELEAEMARLGMQGHRELVLIQPRGTSQPSGTAAWLARRNVSAHYHVRLDVDGDMMHLARRLTGRAVGLVLSGGGARGYAHIGVIRALEEAGVPIDVVGGTSQGALLGGCYALGMHPEAITEAAKQFGSSRHVKDYTLPLVSLFASKKVTKILRALYGEVHIEDLWRPFFCVSTNLTRAEPVVHRFGPMWKYVRASTALPGIFAPVLEDNEILVDGVSMDNLPIETMRDLTEGGPIVAVNVVPERDLRDQYNFGPSVSGWHLLWSKLNPFAQPIRVPSIIATLTRAREANDVYRRQFKQRLADLYLSPQLERFPLLDFSRCDEIVEIGYQTARQALETRPDLLQAVTQPPTLLTDES